ncbi:MAG: hypothetical protein ABW169_10435 [Sphingobium sp.]
MFTKTFTRERHIEELRAELRHSLDPIEVDLIRSELAAALTYGEHDEGDGQPPS